MITVALRRLEATVSQLVAGHEELRADVAGLKVKMTDLEQRVLVLETR